MGCAVAQMGEREYVPQALESAKEPVPVTWQCARRAWWGGISSYLNLEKIWGGRKVAEAGAENNPVVGGPAKH